MSSLTMPTYYYLGSRWEGCDLHVGCRQWWCKWWL